MVRAAYSTYVCGCIDEHAGIVFLCEWASTEDMVSVCDFNDIAKT